MTSEFIRENVRIGDVLMYDRNGFINRAIRLKTGSCFSHCEVYVGNSRSYASRNGIGVDNYEFRTDGLVAIFRPRQQFLSARGEVWFQNVAKGQGYDWFGLFAFWFARLQGSKNRKMFCSEFVVRYLHECGVDIFSEEADADSISPGMITYSKELKRVWSID